MLVRYLLCSILIASEVSSTQAQNPTLDTLIGKIGRLRHENASLSRDTTLILTLSLLTERLYNQNNPQADAYLDTLQTTTRQLPWAKGEGLYLRALGKKHDVQGKYPVAFDYYSQAIAALEKVGGDPYELTYAYILAAFVLNNNGMTDKCITYLQKALPLARSTHNTNNLCWILDFFGDYNYYDSFGVRNYRKALYYYKEVEKYLPRSTSPNLQADNPHGLANCYLRLGDEKKAEAYRNKALEVARKINNRVVIFAIYADLAAIHEDKAEYAQAIAYRQQSLDFARQSGWKEMESRAENYLYQTYKRAGDYRNALRYFEQHKAHEDSLGRYDVQKQYAELQTRYQAEKQQLRIQELENESLIQLRNFLGLSLLLGVLVLSVVGWTNRRLRAKNELLLTKTREIEEAQARGQTLERKRVAGELHDNLNTKVAAIRWRLEAMSKKGWTPLDQKIHGELLGMMNDVYADIRLISHNLLPVELETQGLSSALQKLVATLNASNRIKFYYVGSGQEQRLSPHLEHQLYSVALELVNNIIKHSKAQKAWISLTYQSEATILTVSDNGVGFDTQAYAEGVGLRNISTRVESLKGTWQVDSKPALGTKIIVEVPTT
ncbi:ATP-binding protein [Rhabdobacter roseus]|uniref:histidine kinase n=1 Tax=Rhabdobacter roseus TaxID=1655419 RepID=A0A840U4U1_9BACT|nr:sensor histidine kinase [Rhabdobacter roseus]MBB5287338.1 signal transduction histidine kinase [Rhabdobacter roseus]